MDPKDNKLIRYTVWSDDENVADHLLNSLNETIKELYRKYKKSKPMTITQQQQHEFYVANQCWICNDEWGEGEEEQKVRDHCHYTGKYPGAAHSKCNLRLRRSRIIPIFYHNYTGYDSHLIIRALGKIEGGINVIPINDEKYVSVSKKVPVDEGVAWTLSFLDSNNFMKGALSTHVKYLAGMGKDAFKFTNERFGSNAELLLRKGAFPYDWFIGIDIN